MTHWKRLVLLFWGIIALLVAVTWAISTQTATQANLSVRSTTYSITIESGTCRLTHSYWIDLWATAPHLSLSTWSIDDSAVTIFPKGATPWDVQVVKFPLLFLLLLYLLFNRHYRKKTTAPCPTIAP